MIRRARWRNRGHGCVADGFAVFERALAKERERAARLCQGAACVVPRGLNIGHHAFAKCDAFLRIIRYAEREQRIAKPITPSPIFRVFLVISPMRAKRIVVDVDHVVKKMHRFFDRGFQQISRFILPFSVFRSAMRSMEPRLQLS